MYFCLAWGCFAYEPANASWKLQMANDVSSEREGPL
jgi:hypothetical protein